MVITKIASRNLKCSEYVFNYYIYICHTYNYVGIRILQLLATLIIVLLKEKLFNFTFKFSTQ